MNNTFDIFDEMTNEIDMKLLKLQLFNEAAKREFELNKQQAEIKVLKESGTQSDLNMLYEAAEEGLINKMQRSLKAAIEALKEFIKKIIDKIKSIFQSKQGKETLDKMEDICNKNPNVKNRKIEITDIDKEQKCLQKGIDKLSGIIAKIKGGHNKDSFDKEIDDVIEETNRERAKIIAIGAGITVTVGAVIALIKKYTKTSEDIGKNAIYAVDKNSELNEINDVMSNISGTDIDDDEALQAAKLGNDKVIKAKNAQINLCKERMSSVLNFIKTTGNKLRGKVISRDLEKEMNESTEYIDVSIDSSLDDVNDVAVESKRKQLSKYKNNIEKIKSKLSTYNESVGFDDMIAIETTSLGLNDDSFDILESEIFDI